MDDKIIAYRRKDGSLVFCVECVDNVRYERDAFFRYYIPCTDAPASYCDGCGEQITQDGEDAPGLSDREMWGQDYDREIADGLKG